MQAQVNITTHLSLRKENTILDGLVLNFKDHTPTILAGDFNARGLGPIVELAYTGIFIVKGKI